MLYGMFKQVAYIILAVIAICTVMLIITAVSTYTYVSYQNNKNEIIKTIELDSSATIIDTLKIEIEEK